MRPSVLLFLVLFMPACGFVHFADGSGDASPRASDDPRSPAVVFRSHGEPVLWARFSPTDNTILSSSSPDGKDRSSQFVWNGASGAVVGGFANEEFVDLAGAWANDGRRAAIGERALHVIDIPANRNLHTFPADVYEALRVLDIDQTMPVVNYLVETKFHYLTAVAFSPDDRYIAAGQANGLVRVWSMENRALLAVLLASRVLGEIRDVAFSRDGRFLAVCQDDRDIPVWGFPDYRKRMLAGHGGSVTAIDFAAGGMLASASEDGTVRLWRSDTWRTVRRIVAHRGGVTDVVFTADGCFLATGGANGTVAVWNASTGANIARFAGHEKAVSSVSFNSNATLLASGARDGAVLVWDLSDLGLCGDLARTPAPRFPARLSGSVFLDGASADGSFAPGSAGAVLLDLRNDGEGAAYHIVVMVTPDEGGAAVRLAAPGIVTQLLPGAKRLVEIPLVVEPDASPGTYWWTIRVLEANGFHIGRPLRAVVSVGSPVRGP
ncbi:MAG: WD40 repeat domain-containing protein [Candidatus Krumholzibacteriota bacterium]|nr:WD40 repeat domain-containing protein [Candidatus Krumholzibacteriota bacterium]